MSCEHRTAIVLCEFKQIGLTYLLCTWACNQPYWMLRGDNGVSREINAVEAADLIEGRQVVGKKSKVKPEPSKHLISRGC